MISKKMNPLVQNNSVIRVMFEEGKRLAAIYGAENVYDFSLGNPNVPAPQEVEAEGAAMGAPSEAALWPKVSLTAASVVAKTEVLLYTWKLVLSSTWAPYSEYELPRICLQA